MELLQIGKILDFENKSEKKPALANNVYNLLLARFFLRKTS